MFKWVAAHRSWLMLNAGIGLCIAAAPAVAYANSDGAGHSNHAVVARAGQGDSGGGDDHDGAKAQAGDKSGSKDTGNDKGGSKDTGSDKGGSKDTGSDKSGSKGDDEGGATVTTGQSCPGTSTVSTTADKSSGKGESDKSGKGESDKSGNGESDKSGNGESRDALVRSTKKSGKGDDESTGSAQAASAGCPTPTTTVSTPPVLATTPSSGVQALTTTRPSGGVQAAATTAPTPNTGIGLGSSAGLGLLALGLCLLLCGFQTRRRAPTA